MKKPSDFAPVHCARCGQPFVCGVAAGQAHCWCFDRPRLARKADAGEAGEAACGCYCPACLEGIVAQEATGFQNA